MDTPFLEKAIQMVAVDESTGKYVLTPHAIKFLKAINGPIAVVSVAGLYRTGKSYLLNRVLLNRSNGFGVGSTVNACTKGLWCWGTPIKGTSLDGQPVNIIVIDTEGIGALDQDQTHDTKIFTLAILASSVFIYNSVGSIDQNAIQNLSLVVNLSKHIQLKASGGDDDGQDPDEISSYFPTFYWVVRDFSLQLQDPQGNQISSKEYLEKALAPQNGFSDDVEQKNRIRRLLTAFFKDRDCFTMIRPLVDEQKLQNLDKMDYDQLRPQFVHQAMNFRKRIINSIKGKTLQNQKLNGDMYCSMMNSYVNAINQGAVPNIENAWNYMCQQQCRKVLDDCYELFIKEIKDNLKELPRPEEQFQKVMTEAEQKAVEFFREKALGEKSVIFFKQLKNRIKTTITETRQQNIKESNEVMRNYILKNVNPIKFKLNNHQYKSFSEFQKEVALMSERLMKDGPKLHSYKLVYTQAMRKFSSQGAEFLFKNFTKNQEKEREMFKLKQKQLQTQLQSATEQRQTLRKQLMDYTISNDQAMADLNYRIQTLTTQLKMTEHSKDQEQKKMERQLYAKHSELQSSRRNLELKIKELMQRLDQATRLHNNDKRQWQKDRAIFDLRVKQQGSQIQELTKKQKLLDANLNVSKNESVTQVRAITQKYQSQANQLKSKIKQMQQKTGQLHEEMNSVKQQMQSKCQKFEKREKKYKDDISNRNKEIEKISRDLQAERKKMHQQLQKNSQKTNEQFKIMQQKLKQAEKALKYNQEQMRKTKNSYERDYQMLKDKYQMMVSKYDQEKIKHTELKEKHQSFITKLEESFKEKSEEAAVMKMNQVKLQYENFTNNLKSQFEKEKKNLLLENNVLVRRIQELEMMAQNLKIENAKKMMEGQNLIEQLNDQIAYIKETKKRFQGDKQNEVYELAKSHKFEIESLKNELQELKERSSIQKSQLNKKTEEVIQSLKNSYEIEKESLYNRIKNQKQKCQRKIEQLTNDYQRKIQEDTQPLLNEIQQLNQRLINTEEMLRTQSSQLQHQIDINVKKAESLEKANNELKQSIQKKEKTFNSKYDQLYQQSKIEKQKLEEKIENLVNENNRKDKDLLSTIHIRDQLATSLDKKEAKLSELQKQTLAQKEYLNSQIETLHNKLNALQIQHHNKVTEYQRDIALSNQQASFLKKNISDLTTELSNQKQETQKQMNKLKEELDLQKKVGSQKLISQKSALQSKLKQLKNSSKQSQGMFKKSMQELSKDKESLQRMVANLEHRLTQATQKNSKEFTSMGIEVTKLRQENSSLKMVLGQQKQKFHHKYSQLQNVSYQRLAQLQKEKSLLEQKNAFLAEQREEQKRESEQKINQLQYQISIMQDKFSNEKQKIGNQYTNSFKDSQAKLNSKVSELSSTLAIKTQQYQRIIKDKQMEIKQYKEQLETEKMTKDSFMNKYQKRITEAQEKIKRQKEQTEKLKSQKERKQMQLIKMFKQEKDQMKVRMSNLQNNVKIAEEKKMSTFFQMEKQKSKWSIEKQNFLDQLGNIQDMLKKYERQNTKLRTETEKLKAERKNTKTHSYIGNLKTTYEPSKIMPIEEFNKENVGQQ